MEERWGFTNEILKNKLVTDGKKETSYYVKIIREKGDGRAQGVQGFVGIKDKLDQNISSWLLANNTDVEITKHHYLFLFKTSDDAVNKLITFPGIEFSQKFDLYDDYKQNELIVEIEVIRARIPKKQFKEKIDNIVQKAKQIPL